MKTLTVFLAAFLLILCSSQQVPSCLNHEGKKVDWWVVYYAPKAVRDKNITYGYMYMDSQSNQNTFSPYPGVGDGQNQPHGRTIDSIKALGLESFAWNDQLLPEQKGPSGGSSAHAKLYMGYNKLKTHGFVVSHSIPKYPTPLPQGGYKRQIETSQMIKGQHALCMSLDSSTEIDKLLSNSCFIKPNIFFPTGQKRDFCKSLSFPSKKYFSHTYSIGKTKVIGFYKNGFNSQQDLFSNGIAQELKSTLVVQYFGQNVPNVCANTYKVLNSKQINYFSQTWTRGSDHAKWAYTLDNNDYACFGDLNRQQSQEKRGGAYYCLNSKNLNSALKAINPNFQACP